MTHDTKLNASSRIEKEDVKNLKFPESDVLASTDEKKIRNSDLERALKLGNIEHNKIKIIFEDNEGIKYVETTVWGVTDSRVILKQGILIPIHRIYEIR